MHKGDKVRILSGETHVEPKPLVVLHDFEPIDESARIGKGEIIFLLDCPGEEGACRFWRTGQEFIEDIYVYRYFPFEDSSVPRAEFITPENDNRRAISWIRIALPNGSQGWTKETGKFEVAISEDSP